MLHLSTHPLTSCQGRDAELAQLAQLYEEAKARGPRLALLDGPTGVGKSSIVQEFRSRTRLASGVVLEGRCEPGKAFAPFAEIVDGALRFLEEVGATPSIDMGDLACSAGCHAFWHQHGGDAAGSPALHVSRRGTSPGEVDALERRLRFFEAVLGLLRDVAAIRPPVILLHELGRADQGTHQLLQHLLEGASPWNERGDEGRLSALFLGSARQSDRDERDTFTTLRHHPATVVIRVSTLDEEGVRKLLQSPEIIARVLERTGGLPEAIEMLLDAEPPTPEERLEKRLSALSARVRDLVNALAVLDRPADLGALSRVASVPADAVVFAEFGRSDLVARSIVDGTILFRFARERDREHVYAGIAPEVRRKLHCRALDAVRAAHGDAQEAAKHAIAGDDFSRAAPLALEAADSLGARHAHAEAALLLERVVDAASGQDAIALRERLAELYRVTGEYKRAIAHAKLVCEASPRSAVAARTLGELLTLAGEHDEAAEALQRALELASQDNDAPMVAETEARLAELYYQRGAYEQARTWAHRALDASTRAGNLALEIFARNTLGKLSLAQRDSNDALAAFDDNRAKAAAAGLGHQEAQALTNSGVAMLHRRELEAAEQVFLRAVEVAADAGDTRDRAIATENLAVLAHLRRDYAVAQTRYHEAVTLLKRLGNRAMLARVANNLGALYLSLGDAHRARTMCDFATHVGGHWLPPAVVGEGLMLRGRIEAANDDHAAARAAFEGALKTWQSIGDVHATDAQLELARLHLSDGDLPAARAALASIPPADSRATVSSLALLRVDVDRAAGLDTTPAAEQAVESAQGVGDDELLLPALVRLARAHLDSGDLPSAARHIELARQCETRLSQHVPQDCLVVWEQRPMRRELASIESRVSSESLTPGRAAVGTKSTPPALSGARDPRVERLRKTYPNLVGSSASIVNVLSLLDKVAPSDCLVLVRGESGTGKELVAEALHNNSPRKDKPIVKVNCAALVETLLLSELFGHERGAFTGAQARKKGRFELADGGTLFLDEIGDISPKTQVALLRVLQEREFERVGGTQPIRVDVRIVAATHRDLEKMVREGTFREDLYYRLRGVTIEMPPLRKRLEDLPAVSARLLKRIADERAEAPKTLAPEALRLLASHRWPGNVRELDNVLRSATLFAESQVLTIQDFAAFSETFDLSKGSGSEPPEEGMTAKNEPGDEIALVYRRIRDGDRSLFEMKKDLERECIIRALAETSGNITRAATLLGMKRPRLSQLVKQYGLSHAGEP